MKIPISYLSHSFALELTERSYQFYGLNPQRTQIIPSRNLSRLCLEACSKLTRNQQQQYKGGILLLALMLCCEDTWQEHQRVLNHYNLQYLTDEVEELKKVSILN